MFTGRGLKPVFWGPVLTPHREPAPRTPCEDCRTVGQINDVPCRRCHGSGYTDPQRAARTAAAEPGIY